MENTVVDETVVDKKGVDEPGINHALTQLCMQRSQINVTVISLEEKFVDALLANVIPVVEDIVLCIYLMKFRGV